MNNNEELSIFLTGFRDGLDLAIELLDTNNEDSDKVSIDIDHCSDELVENLVKTLEEKFKGNK